MEAILRANKDSTLIQNETSGKTKELSFSQAEPYPDNAKAFEIISPASALSGSPFTQQQLFNIPAGYYVTLLLFKFSFTRLLATKENTANIGIDMISSLEVTSNGQTIFSTTGEGLYALYNELEPAQKAYVFRNSRQLRSNGEVSNTANSIAVTNYSYLPLFTSFFSGVYTRAINTSVVNTMSVNIRYKSQGGAGSVNDMSGFSSNIYTYRYKPNDPLYQQIVQKDWSGGLKMGTFNVLVETQPITQSVDVNTDPMAEITFQSSCYFNLIKTYVMIKQSQMQNTSVPATNTVFGRPLQRIKDVSVTVGSTPLITSWNKVELDYELAMQMRDLGIYSSVETVTNGGIDRYKEVFDQQIEPICITYGAKSDAMINSGLANYKMLNKPTFKINWAYQAYQTGQYSTDSTLYLVHIYENVLGNEGAAMKIVTN